VTRAGGLRARGGAPAIPPPAAGERVSGTAPAPPDDTRLRHDSMIVRTTLDFSTGSPPRHAKPRRIEYKDALPSIKSGDDRLHKCNAEEPT